MEGSYWFDPEGVEYHNAELHEHYELLAKTFPLGDDCEDRHGLAFTAGFVRVTVNRDEFAAQWGGKLTVPQRSALARLAKSCNTVFFADASDGFDPENWKAESFSNDDSRFERLIGAGLRVERSPWEDPEF
ncbi:hypothetical protein LCGC14_1036310 [marine sediment metagenome]|uniref:Uncharacterized protein n=1 Tax=marine sediment metagenome TaxID=412755 RepID=A0A0F9MT34_9ZZZZ